MVTAHLFSMFALEKSLKRTQNSLNPAMQFGKQCRSNVGNQENRVKKGVDNRESTRNGDVCQS